MKNTILFTMMLMMSYNMVGQSTNVVEHFGYDYPNSSPATPFINNGWYINSTELTLLPQNFIGNNGENISFEEKNLNDLKIYYSQTFGPGQTNIQSTINITKKIPIGYTNLSVKVIFGNPSSNDTMTVDLIEYDLNGNPLNTYSNINISKFNISNSTDSIELIFNVTVPPSPVAGIFELANFKLYGDLITNIQENITNHFNVYSYNKNLIVKTTEFETYALTVYNLSGQEVFTKNTNGNQDIPLTLVTGMYIVNINNGKESFNQKVVVQ